MKLFCFVTVTLLPGSQKKPCWEGGSAWECLGSPPERGSQCGLFVELEKAYLIKRLENIQIPSCLARTSPLFSKELTHVSGGRNQRKQETGMRVGPWGSRIPSLDLRQRNLM